MKIARSLYLISAFCLFLCAGVKAQDTLLQSGPMVGYSSMKEVGLWVQTKAAAEVKVAYWPKGKPTQKRFTASVSTQADEAFVAKLAAPVELGNRYAYTLYINGEEVVRPYPMEFQSQSLWQWRTDPPAFTFALGSCAYVNETPTDRPGKPYGSNYQIFERIAEKQPDFMLWLGDNTYLREADWNSLTGIYHRYTHTRSLPEMQPLLASTHNFAIWDDHDYGPNDADRSFWNKSLTEKAFNLFWMNPNTNQTGLGGITGTFIWNDVQFFLLDDRWFRAPNELKAEERAYFGAAQLAWLRDALAYSKANFKIIVNGGQILNPTQEHENYSNYVWERDQLLRMLEEQEEEGVLFLSGDRHHTVLSKLEREGSYPLYDFTVSPLTSGVGTKSREQNALAIPETYVWEHNFATIEVSGPLEDRKLSLTVFDAEGKQLWQQVISQKVLSNP